MDSIKTLKYKFTRYCVNRAYVNINISNKPAEFVNFLDDVVEEVRDLEAQIGEEPSRVESLFKEILIKKYNELKEKDKKIAKELFINILKNCLELEEISESRLGSLIRQLVKEVEKD